MGIRQISRLLNISRNTVRKVINGEHSSPYQRVSQYEDVLPLVREHFHFCKGNAVRIQEFLKETYELDIPYSTLTRIIRELALREGKKKSRAGEYRTGPGKESQHDTSPHGLIIDGKKITAQCASLVHGYSRKLFFQYYPVYTRFEAKVFLTEAFLYMDGCCKDCIIDNTSVIVAQGSGPDAVIAPEMKRFGDIYGVAFIPHAVGDADRKAKVERNFHYIENNFLAGRTFTSWEDLNRRSRAWCDAMANKKPKRALKGMAPEATHIIETPHLTPLPSHIPPVYKSLQRIVDMSGYVTVDNNRYSVPEALCGMHVEVLKSWNAVTVYYKRRKVAEHKRLIDKKDGKVVLSGHHKPMHRKEGKKAASQEERALLGKSDTLDRYVAEVKKTSYGSGRRKLQKLLSLQRSYPADAFQKAIETGLHYGLYDLTRLENLILSFVAGDFFNIKEDDE